MYYIGSVVLICIAHILRTWRWELFVQTYEKPDEGRLLQALSVGYLFNFFIPFKAGDLARAWIAGRKMKNGKGFALATVIVDRYLDILVVGLFFLFFYRFGLGNGESIRLYMLLSLGLLLVTVLVYCFRGVTKKVLKGAASIFNSKIQARLLCFFWSLIWSFKDIAMKIDKVKLLCTTVGMWIFYVASYSCFATFLNRHGANASWTDVFYALFEKNSIQLGSVELLSMLDVTQDGQMVWMGLYLLAPIALLFALSFLLRHRNPETEMGESEYLNLIPQLDERERLNFLETYFSGEHREYIDSYLKINQNIFIIRDYSAGSNATTMLCMNDGRNFFRKYAFGNDGEKLYEQVKWLEKYQGMIPLPDILRSERGDNYCYYDMPYDSTAVGLFEYAHSMPKEKAWDCIQQAIECLEHSLYRVRLRDADKGVVDQYIEQKVNQNLAKIMNGKYIRRLMDYDEILINGNRFPNLRHYLPYLSQSHLYEIFKDDPYSEIHGDLTIENIICTRDSEGKDGFYLIDPNTGNVHDSSNLDYGKLLQSIHGGYEFLMATKTVNVERNAINFIFTKSEAYTYLCRMLDAYMCEKFSQERVKSIYYHEIVHWLRLMPYKIEKNGKRSLLFYAGMLMVLHDVVKRFEGEG